MKLRQILLIACLMLASGCDIFSYTARKANKQLTRAQATYPAVVAEGCGNWYPPRTETVTNTHYKQGKDSIVHDTLKVKCPDDVNGNPQFVYIPVPEYKSRIDTFFSEKVIEKENTAEVKALRAQLGTEAAARVKAETQAKDWRTGAIAAGILLLIFIFSSYKKS